VTGGQRVPLETLDRKVAELASFLSPSEIFRALLEGTSAGATRASIFLMRESRWKGWSSIGYPSQVASRQRQIVLPAEAGWIGSLAAETDARWSTLANEGAAPDFGQGPYDETVGLPVRVGGKAVAIVIAQRMSGEDPWSPAALSLLCQAARLRLELDLAWRRLKTLTAAAEAARPAATDAASAKASHPPEPPERASPTEMAPWGGSGPAFEVDPRHEEARRYARLVATDIRLYNEEAVVTGRRQRDLAERLDEQLKRGREAFARRFPDIGPEGESLLREAYVQVLAAGDATLFS
jgi:hypothetical protein